MADRNGVDERLARLESNMHSLSENLAALAAQVSRIVDGQRTPWNTLASWSGVLLVIIGIGGSLVHNTLADRISLAREEARSTERLSDARHEGQQALLQNAIDRQAALRGEFDAMASTNAAKLQRVETQLAALSNFSNLGQSELRGWVSEHHARLTGRELPPRQVWPTVGRDVGSHE